MAQVAPPTEFAKELIGHIKLSSGLITAPKPLPAIFQGSIQMIPQYTIIPFHLRGGVVAAVAYAARKVSGLFGPTISYKITELKGSYFGSIGNLHITAEHLWGTNQQRLVGGSVNLDLLNRIVIGLSAHRDYNLASWWLATSFALRISPTKKPIETFPH